MKIIITESQYKLLTEQTSLVKFGCHDLDKVKSFCATLQFPKEEADKLIAKHKSDAETQISKRFDEWKNKIMSMGGDEGKRIAEKFSESISITKGQTIKIIMNYYSKSVYASCGLSPKIDVTPILLEICGIIYSQFIKSWNDNWLMRNAASIAITSKNIKEAQSAGKKILYEIVREASNTIDWILTEIGYILIYDRVYEMEKTTPKCDKAIIVQDRGCNKITPYNPRQTFKNIESPTLDAMHDDSVARAYNTYLPKLTSFLNSLV